MAEVITDINATRIKNDYLKQDNSVNIRKNLQGQQQLKESGLENIEIRDRAKQLGKNDFLELLVTQLTHQDPTAPVKDQQFIAQMAQFSSLEQMQNISTGIGRMADRQSLDLVGKFVVGRDFAGEEQISGVVQALFTDDTGRSFLKVQGRAILVDDVRMIGDPQHFRPEFGGLAPTMPDTQKPAPAEQKNALPIAPDAQKNAPQKNMPQNAVPTPTGYLENEYWPPEAPKKSYMA